MNLLGLFLHLLSGSRPKVWSVRANGNKSDASSAFSLAVSLL